MLLLPYQQLWVSDTAQVQVCEKSRRIGITWASALRAVLEASHAGGWDSYYSGYNSDLAKEFIRDAGEFAELLHVAVDSVETFDLVEDEDGNQTKRVMASELVFEDVDKYGKPKGILGYLIRFASGYQIVALSSHPRNLRGKKGRIILDEFAFHDNGDELLKAALAVIIWGGRLSIISTHDGVDNYFNNIVEDIRAGRFAYSLHRTTLDDALEQGLYERIADVLGLPQTEQAKTEWRANVIESYGEGADEELFCVPRRGGGVYINPELIKAVMTEECKVVRLRVDDDFALQDEQTREQHIAAWAEMEVAPLLSALDSRRATYMGEDFGRRSDLTVISVGQETQDMRLRVPIMVELRNVPYEQQKQFFRWIAAKVPRLGKIAVDATGNGAYLGEVMQQHFGETLCECITLNLAWYAENMPKFRARFEDGDWELPKDLDVRQDIAAFQTVDGVPKLPKVRTQSKDKKGEYRHGDAGVSLLLLEYACRQGAAVVRPNSRDDDTPKGGHFPRGKRITW